MQLSSLSFFQSASRSLHITENSNCSIVCCDFHVESLRTPIQCSDAVVKLTSTSFTSSNKGQLCTLVRTSGPNSQVHFHSSVFDDQVVFDTDPFLTNFATPNLTLSNCDFKNISLGTSIYIPEVDTLANNTISACTFHTSTDVLSGGLLRGLFRSTSLLAVNNTFTRTTSGTVESRVYTPQSQVTTAGPVSFHLCSWTDTSSDITGGAINAVCVGDITITECIFTRSSAKGKYLEEHASGGAIFFDGAGISSAHINETTFYGCHAVGYAGSVGIYNSSKCSLTRTNFSCSTTDYSIPTLHFRNLPSGSVLQNLRFEHSYQTGIQDVNCNSGAIDFDRVLGELYHSNILYRNNTAHVGGAVYYSHVNSTSSPNVTWFSCIFYDNKATKMLPRKDNGIDTNCGNDIWVGVDHVDWHNTIADENKFINCFSTSLSPRIAMIQPESTTTTVFPNGTDLSIRLPNPALFVVPSTGQNHEDCGNTYHLACATLAYALSNFHSSSTGKVLIESGTINEIQSCSIDQKDIVVTSYGNGYPLLKTTTKDAFITVTSSYNLHIQYITFEVSSSPVVKHIGSGTLKLQESTFRSPPNNDILTSSAISASGGDIILVQVVFSHLTFETGSALDCVGVRSVSLTDVDFISINTQQSSPLRIEQTTQSLTLENLQFECCSGVVYSDIQIDASSITLPSSTVLNLVSTSSSPRSAEYDEQQVTSWPSKAILVGEDGVDEEFCWGEGRKCKSLDGVISRVGKNFEGSIELDPETRKEARIVLTEARTLKVIGEKADTTGIELPDSASAVQITSDASLTLSTLTLIVTPPSASNCLVSSSGQLSLTDVIISLLNDASERTGSVISVQSGNTVFTNCRLDGEGKKMGTLAQVSETGQAEFHSSSFKNLVLDASLVLSTGTVTILDTHFESISDATNNNPSARVIQVTIGTGKTVSIDSSSSFVSCSSSGSGGAIHAKLTQETLSIRSVSFEKCSAGGNGGVMWIDATEMSSASQFSFAAASFGAETTPNTCEGRGNVLFIQVDTQTVSDIIKHTQFPSSFTTPLDDGFFSSSHFDLAEVELLSPPSVPQSYSFLYILFPYQGGSLDVDSVNGVDHSQCGHQNLPCKTVAEGARNLKGTGRAVQLTTSNTISGTIESDFDWTLTSDATKRELTLSTSASLVIQQNTFTILSITLSLPSTVPISPFVVSGGTLKIDQTNTIVTQGVEGRPVQISAPLFSVSSGKLTMSGSELSPIFFSYFTSTDDSDVSLIRIGGDTHSKASLTLSHTFFTDCTLTTGAVISFVGQVAGDVKIDSCFFTRNSGTGSNDVLSTPIWEGAFTANTITNSHSDSNHNHFVVGTHTRNDLLPFSVLAVHQGQYDNDKCHLPTHACQSAAAALSHTGQMGTDNTVVIREIRLDTDATETSTLYVGERRVDVRGGRADGKTKLIRSGHSSLLTLTTGTVKLSSLILSDLNPDSDSVYIKLTGEGVLTLENVEHDGESKERAVSLISTTTGSLFLSSFSAHHVTMTESPLITTKGPLTAVACVFTSITRTQPKPSVFSSTLSSDVAVSVVQTTFEGCSASDTDRWVELIGTNSASFETTNWEGTFTKDSNWDEIVVDDVKTVGSVKFNPFSLLYLFSRRSEKKIVVKSTSSSRDHPLCGHKNLPCASIEGGMELTKERVVDIDTIGAISTCFEMNEDDLTLAGHQRKGTLRFVKVGQIVSGEEGTLLSLAHLSINFIEWQGIDISPFTIEAGSMEMKGCTFDPFPNLSFVVISMSGEELKMNETTVMLGTSTGALVKTSRGNLSIETMTIESTSFASPPFVLSGLSKATLKSITMEKTTVTELISISSSNNTSLESSRFIGITQPSTRNTDDLCEWETGLVRLTQSDCLVSDTYFIDLDEGAMLVDDSNATILTATFLDNTPNHAVFRSAHRNMRCVGESAVNVRGLSGGDGFKSDSMWISTDETCRVMKDSVLSKAPFFTPTLDASSSKCASGEKGHTLTLKGELLVPCGLCLEVFEMIGSKSPKTEGNSQAFLITAENGTEWTEESVKVTLSSSQITLDHSHELRARLSTTHGFSTSQSLRIKVSAADERKSQASKVISLVVPIVCSVIALFILLIILVVLIRRRRNKQNLKSKDVKEELNLDIKEDDGLFDNITMLDHTRALIHADDSLVPPGDEAKNATKVAEKMSSPPQNVVNPKPLSATNQVMVEAIGFSDKVEVKRVNKADTLYRRLHGSKQKDMHRRLVDSAEMGKMLTRTLENIAQHGTTSDILSKLTPHRITFDENDNLFFKMMADAVEGPNVFGSLGASRLEQSGFEELRWLAPEAVKVGGTFDTSKAAVFSLGLILWEMETGQVPFSELDAQNAQRLLGTGTALNCSDIDDDDLEEMIKQCLDPDPSGRPTLHELAEFCWRRKMGSKKEEEKPEPLPADPTLPPPPHPFRQP